MVDLKNLSKIKYIYRIYLNNDDELHCERYPVVYINSKAVYFKESRKQDYLNYISFSDVFDNFAKFCENRSNLLINNYFWSVEDNIDEIFEELKKRVEAAECAKNEQMIKSQFMKAKDEYEFWLNMMNELSEAHNN